jgi:hypothetical protein
VQGRLTSCGARFGLAPRSPLCQCREHTPDEDAFISAATITLRALALTSVLTLEILAQSPDSWPVHSPDRPVPPIVDPGPVSAAAARPSDAIVLFDGKDLSQWRAANDSAARWKVENDYFEVVPGTGSIQSARGFGDVQLHIEWATPAQVTGSGQGRGNSGLFLMGKYEIQILDSWQNRTYADGQAAALYGQFPPLVNASRPPGEWQSYDIVFHAPRFDGRGELVAPARVTLLHNGVLVQDNVALSGPTGHYARPPYEAHPDRLPLSLQDHGNPLRFRNIWVREL